MAKTKEYTSADIQALSDREHVRLRTQVYLGNTHPATYHVPLLFSKTLEVKEVEFVPAAYRAIGEILDNSIDELLQASRRNKVLTFDYDRKAGKYAVSDNGRGIPIDKHSTGRHTPEVALAQLKAGRNFSDDKEIGVIGQNGVGAACTNYCSSEMNVKIVRDGKVYTQTFKDGANTASKPRIVAAPTTAMTGTTVEFTLDPKVFSNTVIPDELIRNRAIEIAMTNPGLTVQSGSETYQFKNGAADVIDPIIGTREKFVFKVQSEDITGEIYVVLNAHESQDEQIFTWVNSSLLYDGGKCNAQLMNALVDAVSEHLQRAASKTKTEITRNDVRSGLLVFACLKVRNPQYDSQSKTRLTGPDMRKELTTAITADWKAFAKSATGWLTAVLENASKRHHSKENEKAQKEHQKNLSKRVPGLLDATNKDRSKCQLLVTEGESAQSQICEVRNPETTAALALTGKINNVWDATVAEVLKMVKVVPLLAAIGLVPGKKADRKQLNYGRVILSTDADYDGDDIFTLLVNLFYKFWPELLDPALPPFIFRLTAPNVCAIKGTSRVHFTTHADFERAKGKYKNWSIQYYKGLGSMESEDWDMILADIDKNLIAIADTNGKLGETLKLLFSDDADARKVWLSTNHVTQSTTKNTISARSATTRRAPRKNNAKSA